MYYTERKPRENGQKMPSLNRARHQTTVDDETDKLALVDHKPQCGQNLLEIATFDFYPLMYGFIFPKIKVLMD